MSEILKGRAWVFSDDVDTDLIYHNKYLAETDPKNMPQYAFEYYPGKENFAKEVKPGDFVVAGKNFGFGSHRAMANEVMKDLGVSCIVADSIARIYFRNAIAAGCVAISCPGVSRLFREGDELELNILTGEVRNATTGESLQGQAYPPELLEILENGGMIPAIVSRFSK